MMLFVIKTLISAILIATIATVSKRYPGVGGLIASLPLVSVLGMIWLWFEKSDAENMATHVESTRDGQDTHRGGVLFL